MRTVVQTLMPASDCMSTSRNLYYASLCSLLEFDVPQTVSAKLQGYYILYLRSL